MRYLMSPPDHLDPHFLFNPWMRWSEEVSPLRASAEWEQLRRTIERAGGTVEVMPAAPEAPAMTFTRDGAIVLGGRAVILNNGGPRGISEPPLVRAWFASRGFPTEQVPYTLEGGNLLRASDGTLLVGTVPDTDGRGERYLAALAPRLEGTRAIGIALSDLHFLHLDLVLADLAGRGWLVHPAGLGDPDLTRPSWRAVLRDRPVISVERADAARLACNVLVVGETVISAWLPDAARDGIAALGLDVVIVSLNEFRKAGGGVHCLTLELPVPDATSGGTR